ncbi:MAG TPA: 3-hydroxyacyl-ACP dehydratase FabZ, partial [Desulfobacteraceae bacterium]|nr:3-hydroxyacyl-ACP dehydratase FabZ [Desulfobacteraceae bacterium]
RFPFLLVDRITELEPGKRVVGIKNVTATEFFFQGHFPGKPIMPGVLIVESMAQTGGVLARITLSDVKPQGADAVYFMSIDRVKFRRPVVPGDQLRCVVEALRTGNRVWKMAGKAYVEDEIAAEAELVAAVG